jgi:glycosyltransferase involved in cell wall biosynthesis
MRIIHIIQTLDPVYGGPPVTAVRLACAQANLGHDVHILSYIHGDEADIHDSLRQIPYIEKIKLSFLARPTLTEKVVGWSAKKTILKLFPGAHIVHLHGVWDTIIRVAANAARRLRIPYFLTPHGMLDSWSMEQKALKKKIALAICYRTIINNASCLHVLNSYEAELLAPLQTRAPYCIIPNGVFLEEIDNQMSDCSELLSQYSVNGAPFILFLSRLHYKKGLDYLANSFALLCKYNPDIHLVVAGPDFGAKKDFESLVSRHGLTNRVHLVGPIYGALKFSLLRAASCFCLPSRQEGFSIAILEALACALPVVISEECHFPEVNVHGAGVVTPLCVEDLANALRKVVENKEMREQMAIAGRRLVEDNFSWIRVAEHCLSTYLRFS